MTSQVDYAIASVRGFLATGDSLRAGIYAARAWRLARQIDEDGRAPLDCVDTFDCEVCRFTFPLSDYAADGRCYACAEVKP